ncbi:MAG: hypothetical protein K2Y22_05640 [Candidatus Obscuribacterales bacterium]|nr:hypothetical protein [Candidatus Obscuribacterales bacterium]
MERTLFTPAMIETFKVCRKAYWMAYESLITGRKVASGDKTVKSFLLRAIAEINRGKVANMHQLLKFMGQHWPADEMSNDRAAKAFLYTHKTLSQYLLNGYKPAGAQIVGINLKVRARIGSLRVYLEDTFDLILYYPSQRRLELVDFHLKPLKPFDPAWPSSSMLVKQYLAEKLRCRWPFDKVSMTFVQIGSPERQTVTIPMEESTFRLHWPDLLKTLSEMKEPEHYDCARQTCKRCNFLEAKFSQGRQQIRPISKTA